MCHLTLGLHYHSVYFHQWLDTLEVYNSRKNLSFFSTI